MAGRRGRVWIYIGDVIPGFIWSRGRVVEARQPVDEPVVLLVVVDAGSVRVSEGSGEVRVVGRGGRHSTVAVNLEERNGKKVAVVTVDSADAQVTAPARALAVIADASSVRASLDSTLEYVSVRADSSGVKARARIAPGGGVYVRADSSTVAVEAEPSGPGEYWADVESDSSGVRISFNGRARYEVEERSVEASSIRIAQPRGDVGATVRVRVRADSSSVKLE